MTALGPRAQPAPMAGKWWSVPLAAALILAICAQVGLATVWPPLHAQWSNRYGAFSHGYLVVVMSVWMAVASWRDHPPARLAPRLPGFILLAACVLVLGVMDALFLNSSRMVLLPIVLLAAVDAVFGRDCTRRLFWPAAFLYTALPQWWVINGPLQALTTAVAGGLTRLAGLPAFMEGNYIHVPAGTFVIASGCSGLGYLIAALSLAGFQALMYLRTWRNRLLLVGVAILLALLANWIRVFALIVVGIRTDMQHYLIRVEHLTFGWVVFLILIAPIYWLLMRLSSREHGTVSGTVPRAAAAPSVAGAVLVAAVVAGAMLLVPRALAPRDGWGPAPVGVPPLPASIAGAERIEAGPSAWAPVFSDAVVERAIYPGADSRHIEVFRASYPHQTLEHRLVKPEHDFFGLNFRNLEDNFVSTRLGDVGVDVIETRGHLEGERLVWHWYWIAGRPATSKLGAKMLEVWGLARGRRDAAGIALSTPCVPDCAAARARLDAFTRNSGRSLH